MESSELIGLRAISPSDDDDRTRTATRHLLWTYIFKIKAKPRDDRSNSKPKLNRSILSRFLLYRTRRSLVSSTRRRRRLFFNLASPAIFTAIKDAPRLSWEKERERAALLSSFLNLVPLTERNAKKGATKLMMMRFRLLFECWVQNWFEWI